MTKSKINKKDLLRKFVEFPKTEIRHFFSREMHLLNCLIDRYSIEFVKVLNFNKKFDSMAIIISDALKPEIDKKFKNFTYKIDHSKYEDIEISEFKSGEDFQIKIKPKTIRNFLNG